MSKITDDFSVYFSADFFVMAVGKLLQVLMLIMLGLVANFLLKKFIKRLLKRSPSKIDERKSKTIINLVSSILKYIIIFFVILEILRTFGLEMSSLLTLAGLGSVAIGFGAQSIVKDIFTGMFILLEDQYAVGDTVMLEGRTGSVEAIGLRTTTVRTIEGDIHIIPNGEIRIVTNMSNRFRRAIIDLEVSYTERLDNVLSALEDEMAKAAQDLPNIKSTPTVLGIMSFAENGVSIRIVAECENDQFSIERSLRKRIKDRFDQEDITIATPRRTVYYG